MDKLDDNVDEYNYTYHRTLKKRPAHVNSGTYIDFDLENNDKGPKLKICNHATVSKYKNTSVKSCTPNWSEDVFVIKKVKNIVLWTYVIEYLSSEEIIVKQSLELKK